MCKQLPDRDVLFAVLREFRPVRRDPLLVVEPPSRMRNGQRHCGQPLGGRMDDHHRVRLPWVTCVLVPDSAPQIDDFLAVLIHTARAAQLAAPFEVLLERIPHLLESGADVSLRGNTTYCCHGLPPSGVCRLQLRRDGEQRAQTHVGGSTVACCKNLAQRPRGKYVAIHACARGCTRIFSDRARNFPTAGHVSAANGGKW